MLPRSLVVAAAESFLDLVRAVPSGRWDGPGLGEWDLRSLVGHTARSMTTLVDYASRPAETVEVPSAADYFRQAALVAADQGAAILQRGAEAGRALGDDPAARVAELLATARAALETTPANRVVVTAMGAMRFEEYLRTRSFELVVHGLDIARAIGSDQQPPGPAVADALLVAAGAAAGNGDGGVAVLLALTGRGALPPGFSVV